MAEPVSPSPASVDAGVEARDLRRLAPYFPVAIVLFVLASLLYVGAQATILQDTWMSLVAGREIVRDGLPSTDHLTVLAAGRDWIDQQWLAQLVFYGIESVGGLTGVAVLGAAAALLAYGIVLVSALREGPVSPALLTGIGLLAIASAPWALQVRAQELALPLFAGVIALLLADPTAARRRTLLVLPLLCLWANVHGSVLLGAGLVLLFGATVAVAGRLDRRAVRRALPYLLVPPVSVFVSPYGLELVDYYQLLLVDPPFEGMIDEWNATRPEWITAAFFVLAALTAVVVAARWRRFSAFELVLLAVTLVTALDALHNVVFFSLAAVAVLPPRISLRRPEPSAAGGAFTLAVAASTAVICLLAVAAPPSHYDELGERAADAVSKAVAGADGHVYADDAHADWVLWTTSAARGRVLYDNRLELVERADIRALANLQALRAGYRQTLAGVDVIVAEPARARRFVRDGWGREVYADDSTAIVVRGGAG